ncbi:hypothetical protein EYF80_003894 [Liparis tanakae]|uniref:Secreted protein n=1 Tax=Liparis tanakae TaxID=230148 RepID=A0A4Z2J7I1_9TELE|nr:hypothetical protein EYF80_003894 [Liparis tanakae]
MMAPMIMMTVWRVSIEARHAFLLLTFHSKPVTAMPPAAPVPASPMNRPEPSELAKRDAPIWAQQGTRGETKP